MDIALAVERLFPDALYRDASSYARLKVTWFDSRKLPTEAELDTAWESILADRQAEAERQARVGQRETGAKTTVKTIPAWATMTETEAITFIQTNVTDLPSAKTVLIAMARIIVHLRDAQWPDLGEN